MIGRHYIERRADPANPVPEGDVAHIMRSSYPEDERVTYYPLPIEDAQTHADSLNANDQDDIRKYGEVQP